MGTFWAALRACGLGADHVLCDPSASIAMTLVHEATHARLDQAGILYTAELRPRIERLCVRQKIDFCQRVPACSALMQSAVDAVSIEWWGERQANEGRRRQILRLLGGVAGSKLRNPNAPS